MLHNPYKVVRMFEEEIANYTGAPYAISVDSCTNALFLICKYNEVKEVTIPSKTYLSVPQSIIHAGGEVIFDKRPETNHWVGAYQLKPYPIWDAAKRLTKDMYMTPQQAAHGLAMFQNLAVHNSDQGELNGYRDLTEFTVFKNNKVIE